MPTRSAAAVLLLNLALVGCGSGTPAAPEASAESAPDGPEWFEDITERLGIRFVHDAGPVEKHWMFQSTSGGCALEDLDGDGKLDILLLNAGGPESKSINRLYRQKPDGTFEDVSTGSGLDFPGWTMGVALGDVDRDGLPDLAITEVGRTRLFLNRGGMKFQDVNAEAGIRNPLWATSAAFFDYDRDGRLDLFVVNYVDYNPAWECRSPAGVLDYCSPRAFPGTSSKLFRNRGPGKNGAVTFEDVSAASHIGDLPGPGLGLAVADFDGNGWPDVFVANDGQPNRLWMNRGDGTFADEAALRGVAFTHMGQVFAGMGIALGDVDNDGLQDLYVTHLSSETNTLWKQGPRGYFQDASTPSGLMGSRERGTGFGTLFADFNLDGFLDIAVANGRVSRDPSQRPRTGLSPHWLPYAERNQLFLGLGESRFKDISLNSRALCGYDTVSRGMASADLDGDGAPDLLVTGIGERVRVLRNVAPDRGHWLSVRAIDPAWKGPAIGAEVAVKAGGVRRVRHVTSTQSYLSAMSANANFGLGAAAAFEGIEVLWPDGSREAFPGGASDRALEIRKGTGRLESK